MFTSETDIRNSLYYIAVQQMPLLSLHRILTLHPIHKRALFIIEIVLHRKAESALPEHTSQRY